MILTDKEIKLTEEELKLGLIVDQIVGFEDDKFDFKYEENGKRRKTTHAEGKSVLKEWNFERLADNLKKSYPDAVKENSWFVMDMEGKGDQTITLGEMVDSLIDGDPNRWKGVNGRFTYSESDRQRIVQRCAERIVQRLKKYSKKYRVQYKVFKNGRIGFRYE